MGNKSVDLFEMRFVYSSNYHCKAMHRIYVTLPSGDGFIKSTVGTNKILEL